jgi:hypothetical protein
MFDFGLGKNNSCILGFESPLKIKSFMSVQQMKQQHVSPIVKPNCKENL